MLAYEEVSGIFSCILAGWDKSERTTTRVSRVVTRASGVSSCIWMIRWVGKQKATMLFEERSGAMKLTMKGDYGLRAMLDLAAYYGQGPIESSDIASRQYVPVQYLDQSLS